METTSRVRTFAVIAKLLDPACPVCMVNAFDGFKGEQAEPFDFDDLIDDRHLDQFSPLLKHLNRSSNFAFVERGNLMSLVEPFVSAFKDGCFVSVELIGNALLLTYDYEVTEEKTS